MSSSFHTFLSLIFFLSLSIYLSLSLIYLSLSLYFPLTPHARPLVYPSVDRSFGLSVGRLDGHNLLKGREVTLPCFYRITCYIDMLICLSIIYLSIPVSLNLWFKHYHIFIYVYMSIYLPFYLSIFLSISIISLYLWCKHY